MYNARHDWDHIINFHNHSAKSMELLFLGTFILCILLGISAVIKRGFEFAKLCKDGAPITGTITDKSKRSRKGRTRYYITYEYLGWNGGKHSHRSVVSNEVFDSFEIGSPIKLIASRSKPSVSAPAYLVELAKNVKPSKPI